MNSTYQILLNPKSVVICVHVSALPGQVSVWKWHDLTSHFKQMSNPVFLFVCLIDVVFFPPSSEYMFYSLFRGRSFITSCFQNHKIRRCNGVSAISEQSIRNFYLIPCWSGFELYSVYFLHCLKISINVLNLVMWWVFICTVCNIAIYTSLVWSVIRASHWLGECCRKTWYATCRHV